MNKISKIYVSSVISLSLLASASLAANVICAPAPKKPVKVVKSVPKIVVDYSKYTINNLEAYFNKKGLTVEKQNGYEGAAGTPVYQKVLELTIKGKKVTVYQYNFKDAKIKKLISDAAKTGQFPYAAMGNDYMKVKGVLNGSLVLGWYDSHPNKSQIISVFKSFKP